MLLLLLGLGVLPAMAQEPVTADTEEKVELSEVEQLRLQNARLQLRVTELTEALARLENLLAQRSVAELVAQLHAKYPKHDLKSDESGVIRLVPKDQPPD